MRPQCGQKVNELRVYFLETTGWACSSGSATESDGYWLVNTKKVRGVQTHGTGSEHARIPLQIPEQFALRYARTSVALAVQI
jgi:hypothetical protein